MKNPYYVVELIPKIKDSNYPKQLLKPHLDEVKWDKKRAIKEAKFAMTGKMWTGLALKDVYKFKLKRIK